MSIANQLYYCGIACKADSSVQLIISDYIFLQENVPEQYLCCLYLTEVIRAYATYRSRHIAGGKNVDLHSLEGECECWPMRMRVANADYLSIDCWTD